MNGTQQSVRGECSPWRMQSSVLHHQHLAVAVVRGFLSHILSLLSYNPSCRCRLSGHDLFSKQPVARDSYSCFTTHVAPQPEQSSVDLLPRGSDELVVAQARRWTVNMFSRACDALCKYLLVDIRGLVLGDANSAIAAPGPISVWRANYCTNSYNHSTLSQFPHIFQDGSEYLSSIICSRYTHGSVARGWENLL